MKYNGARHATLQCLVVAYFVVRLANIPRAQGFLSRKTLVVHPNFVESAKNQVSAVGDNQKEDDKDESTSNEEVQRRINDMMIDAESQDTLFGAPRRQRDDDDGQVVPLFTGIVALLFTTLLTFYGFFSFFTEKDPLADLLLSHLIA